VKFKCLIGPEVLEQQEWHETWVQDIKVRLCRELNVVKSTELQLETYP
jgi:hypothetical protein